MPAFPTGVENPTTSTPMARDREPVGGRLCIGARNPPADHGRDAPMYMVAVPVEQPPPAETPPWRCTATPAESRSSTRHFVDADPAVALPAGAQQPAAGGFDRHVAMRGEREVSGVAVEVGEEG